MVARGDEEAGRPPFRASRGRSAASLRVTRPLREQWRARSSRPAGSLSRASAEAADEGRGAPYLATVRAGRRLSGARVT